MRILKLSAYCFPEQESSTHLTDDLYEAYEKAGFYVENYVPTPTRGVSDEVRNKYKKIRTEVFYNGHLIIHRFSMFREGKHPAVRAFRYVLVNIVQYWKGSHAENIDIIFSGSTPPTQGMLCALVKRRLSKKYKRPVKMIYAIQDIFPDSLVTSGMTQKGSFLWRIGSKMSGFAFKNADQIITISQSMKCNLISKGVSEDKINVISNWIDISSVNHVNRKDNSLFDEYSIDRKKYIVLYAGNMGAPQGTEVILQAAELLKDKEDIHFVIFGGGTEYESFSKSAEKMSNITVNTLLPVERVSEVYSMGDVALITCKKGVGTSGMPSKIWSIMACNTPIIASFDLKSDLSETLKEAHAGATVSPGDSEALANEIFSAYLRWKNNDKNGVNTRDYVYKNAEKTTCVKRYVDIIERCKE